MLVVISRAKLSKTHVRNRENMVGGQGATVFLVRGRKMFPISSHSFLRHGFVGLQVLVLPHRNTQTKYELFQVL